LEKKKHQFNQGNMDIKGNQAENMAAFQSAIIHGGLHIGGYKVHEILQNSSKPDKEYDLSVPEQFAEFGEKVMGNEYFATAVILCVFDCVELDDLQELKSKLLEELPKATDDEGKELKRSNPFTASHTLLKSIKGQLVVMEIGDNLVDCARLPENREIALKNLWQQFPELHSCIARWLLNVSESFKYRTNFETAQITSAFLSLLKIDFSAGTKHLFERIRSTPNKFWLLSFIAFELYNDDSYRKRIIPHLNDWAESTGWLWMPALYVYANMKNEDGSEDFSKKIKKTLVRNHQALEYEKLSDAHFPYIGMLLTVSERLRDFISSMLGKFMERSKNYNEKQLIGFWYIDIMRYGYYIVNSETVNLPLVVCDQKKQLEDLMPLTSFVMSIYVLRQFLFALLESYLKEISKYNVQQKTVKRLKAYFQALSGIPQHKDDVVLFLSNCKCTLATDLKNFIEGDV